MRLAVSGPVDLTDAFEMALSLGPADSLILEVRRNSNDGPRLDDAAPNRGMTQ